VSPLVGLIYFTGLYWSLTSGTKSGRSTGSARTVGGVYPPTGGGVGAGDGGKTGGVTGCPVTVVDYRT